MLLLAHDTAFGVFEELDDCPDLRAVGHLILNLVDHIENARLSMEQQTVGIGDVLLHLLVDPVLTHPRIVWSSVGQGLAASDDKGRDVV